MVVDGTRMHPGNQATADDREAFQEKENQALATIILGISDDLVYLVSSCYTSKKAWDSLRKHFEKNSL